MNLQDDIERVLFSEVEIESAIDRIAGEVTRLFQDQDFTVVSVLKGSLVFTADLIRRIPIPLEIAFVGVSSYGSETSPGALELERLPAKGEIEGRSLLIVDDILDTGRTLDFVRRELGRLGARDVHTCVFLDKPSRRLVPIEPDLRGFLVDDSFVVGYGLDFAGRYRNLPFVGALRAEVFERLRKAHTPGS